MSIYQTKPNQTNMNTCSTNLKTLQEDLIKQYNRYIQLKTPQSQIDWEIALKCMTEYLDKNKANPEMNYDTLLRTYYHTLLPMREKIKQDQHEIDRMRGIPRQPGDPETRFEAEKEQYDAVIYTRILLTAVATVFLYYTLLNLMKTRV